MIFITLNELCTQLFELITKSSDSISISTLARDLHISPRQVRYNLDKIDEFLKYNNFPQLVRKQNVGVSYATSKETLEAVKEQLQRTEASHYVASQQERIDMILAVLLQQQDYITIDFIAEKLAISRSTVINDLKKVRQYLKNNHLQLHSSTNHGIKIIGDERQLRRTSIELLMKSIETRGLLSEEISPIIKKMRTFSQLEISKMFADMDIQFIEGCVMEAEKQLETIFSDEAFDGLVIHIAIAIKRIKLGRDIVMSYKELKNYETTKEFAAASYIAHRLEEQFDVEVPYDEIGYITIHLLGSNVYTANPLHSTDWAMLQALTGKILHEVSQRLEQDFLNKDEQLFLGLLEHLRPAMYRLKNDLKLKNPVLTEIKSSYHRLFEIVRSSMAPVENHVGKQFNDEEIGYFTLHFGAALEKRKTKQEVEKKVLVVCSTGVGTARLLSSRLQQLFHVDIVDVVAYRQVAQVLAYQQVDLIVTTLPVTFDFTPWVQVNPLLLEKDVARLKQYLTEYNFQPQTVLTQIWKLIKTHCEIKSEHELIAGLAKILKTDNIMLQRGVVQPLLRDILTTDRIKLKVKAKNWEEVIYAGGKILEEAGLIEPRYTEAMINTVKKMGAYIVIAKGIAMPHARPEDGAKEVGTALLTLETPVEFGNKENDPVSVVIFLCAVDSTTHLKALADLMQLMDDEDFKELADNATSNQEILDYINREM